MNNASMFAPESNLSIAYKNPDSSSMRNSKFISVKKESLDTNEKGELSVKCDKMISKFLENNQRHTNKNLAKALSGNNESFAKLRNPETVLNNEIVRLLYQNQSDIFRHKLLSQLKSSFLKYTQSNVFDISNEVDIIFWGAESVISAIRELGYSRLKRNIKEHSIRTNDYLDATKGIDLLEIAELHDDSLVVNLIQVGSKSDDAIENYFSQHQSYINDIAKGIEIERRKQLEAKANSIMKKVRIMDPEHRPGANAELDQLIEIYDYLITGFSDQDLIEEIKLKIQNNDITPEFLYAFTNTESSPFEILVTDFVPLDNYQKSRLAYIIEEAIEGQEISGENSSSEGYGFIPVQVNSIIMNKSGIVAQRSFGEVMMPITIG